MKVFSNRGYRIATARSEVKVVYSIFLLLAAVGLATMVILESGRIGLSTTGIATHFLGGDYGEEMRFARGFGELVEVTHFHAFVMGSVYLILAHLLVATDVPPWLCWSTIFGTGAALLGDLVAPWLIRYASASFSGVLLASWVVEWLGLGVMIGVPLAQMWHAQPVVDDEDD